MTDFNNKPPADINLPVANEPGGFSGRWAKAHHILLYFVVATVVVWLSTGFYRVNADEVAIIERLGQFLHEPDGKAKIFEPGVSYHMPWPIDTVHKIPVQQKRTLTVNTFNAPADAYEDLRRSLLRRGASAELIGALFDPYVITGDKNVVHIELAVQYRIEDPEAWLMTVAGQHKDTRDARESMMNFMVCDAVLKRMGRLPVDGVLLEGRRLLPEMLGTAIDDAMSFKARKVEDAQHEDHDHDHAHKNDPDDNKMGDGHFHDEEMHIGVKVSQVDLVVVRPPNYVKTAFEAVLQAQADREVLRNRATTEANNLLNQAEAQARQQLAEGDAYYRRVVEAAKGESARFEQVYIQYRNAPDITKWSLYTETLRQVIGSADRVFSVQPGQKTVLSINPPEFDANRVQQNNPGQ